MSEPRDAARRVIDLLDAVESVVVSARRVVFTSGVIVNETELLDLLDRARRALPEDVKEARQITDMRDTLLEAAEAEARRVGTAARAEAEQIRADAAAHARAVVEAGDAEAERRLRAAEAESRALVASHAVTAAAGEAAAAIRAAAEADSARARAETDAFLRDLLTACDAQVSRAQAALRRALEALPPR